MELTPDVILTAVCQTLELDRDALVTPQIIKDRYTELTKYHPLCYGLEKKYQDGKRVCAYLMRRMLIQPKVVYSKRADGVRAWMESDKPITYKEIAYIFKCKPQTIMASELTCNDLLQSDKDFKKKYDMVVSVLDGNTNIA